jgi:hypothetical protein
MANVVKRLPSIPEAWAWVQSLELKKKKKKIFIDQIFSDALR